MKFLNNKIESWYNKEVSSAATHAPSLEISEIKSYHMPKMFQNRHNNFKSKFNLDAAISLNTQNLQVLELSLRVPCHFE